MKRIVKIFQDRFAASILDGTKRSTIRNLPKRLEDWPQPGDLINARQWSGRPYGSPQRSLCELLVTGVSEITIEEDGITHDMNGCSVPPGSPYHDTVARQEGFKDWDEMKKWFVENYYSLPFTGILIEWTEPT